MRSGWLDLGTGYILDDQDRFSAMLHVIASDASVGPAGLPGITVSTQHDQVDVLFLVVGQFLNGGRYTIVLNHASLAFYR